MAIVPDFLIKRIYKKGSLRLADGAIEFDLKNVLGPGAISGFEYVQINGHKFKKEITYFVTQGAKKLAETVSEINPIHFRLGQEGTFRLEEEVECIKTKSCSKAIEKIISKTKNQSIAIICKTRDEIKRLQKESELIKKFKVLDNLETVAKSKKIITTPAKAKGIEFDCVIIPFANEENYNNELDRNLLYVASTRALHKLYFLSDNKPSNFLVKSKK